MCSCLGLAEEQLVPAGIVDRARQPILLEHQHRGGGVVHEAGAAIYPMAELVEKVAQAAGKAALESFWIGKRLPFASFSLGK
jgi:hypothetical protein